MYHGISAWKTCVFCVRNKGLLEIFGLGMRM